MQNERQQTQSDRNKLIFHYCRVNQKLILAKIYCVVYYGGCVSLFAYLTIHMKLIGLTEAQIGIIYACLPAATLLGPPLLGPISDRFQQHKIILFIFIILNVIFHLLLLVVPYTGFYQAKVSSGSLSHRVNRVLIESELGQLLPFSGEISVNSCFNSTGQPLPGLNSCIFNYSVLFGNADRNNAKQQPVAVNLTRSLALQSSICSQQFHSVANCQFQFMNHSLFVAQPSGSSVKTFILYLLYRSLTSITTAVVFVISDAIMLALVAKYKGDYGMQRFWQGVGFAVGPPLTGLMIDKASSMAGYTTYVPAFIVFAVCGGLGLFVLLFMEVPKDVKATSVVKNLGLLVRYPNIIAFFIATFLLGANWGYLEAFIFVFFKELNASGWQMGLTITAGNVAGLPLVFASRAIFKRTGHIAVIIAAFYVYAIRYWGYSLVREMRWVYFLEMLECITTSLALVAAVSYSATITPPGMYATIQTIVGALHFGLGRGAGSLIGGLLWKSYGARRSYQIMGVGCLISGTMYLFAYLCWFRYPNDSRRANQITALKLKEVKKSSCDHKQIPQPNMSAQLQPLTQRPQYLPQLSKVSEAASDLESTENGQLASSQHTLYFDALSLPNSTDIDSESPDELNSRKASIYLSASSLY